MNLIRTFFKSKTGKRAMWTVLNSIMALIISFLTYMASENVTWAVSILPFATASAQFLTRLLNKPSK